MFTLPKHSSAKSLESPPKASEDPKSRTFSCCIFARAKQVLICCLEKPEGLLSGDTPIDIEVEVDVDIDSTVYWCRNNQGTDFDDSETWSPVERKTIHPRATHPAPKW